MNTAQRLEQALHIAQQLGYGVRLECLDGAGGGGCEFGGQKWIFVDLAVSVAEQLEQVLEVLREDPRLLASETPEEVCRLIESRKAA